MTAILATSAGALDAVRQIRVAVTGAPTDPPTVRPDRPDPTIEPGAQLQDALRSHRKKPGWTWCPACDVTWHGAGECFACGTDPTTNL